MQTFAEGTTTKILAVVGLAVLAFGGGTCLGPWTAEYEVKTAAKTACNDLVKLKRGYTDIAWERTFTSKCNAAGVRLKPAQYAFKLEESKGERLWRCNYKAAWKSSTPIFVLADFLPDLPSLNQVHRLDGIHEVRNEY